MIKSVLETLLVGKPKPFHKEGEMSAIIKSPVGAPVMLGFDGLEGDQVADIIHHGGRDKAIHLYPVEHYSFWRDRYPDLDFLDNPGAFGENLSCRFLTEDELHLGDIFRIGQAVVQCSHARQPCWKLNHRFGKPDVLKTVVKSTKSGCYFRILEPGLVAAGDAIIQIDRPRPDWPLSKLFRMIIGGHHKGRAAELTALSQMPELAENWRTRASQLAAQ
jgi:MOSC domain-containing protein YiiM